jgi:hypothetical protein
MNTREIPEVSLHDQFAGQAMAALIIAGPKSIDPRRSKRAKTVGSVFGRPPTLSEMAYDVANEMMYQKERLSKHTTTGGYGPAVKDNQ